MGTRGRCYACGKTGPPGRTSGFLCGDCADPAKIIEYCKHCGQRRELPPTPETIAMLRRFRESIPDRTGITIIDDACALCQERGVPKGETRFAYVDSKEFE